MTPRPLVSLLGCAKDAFTAEFDRRLGASEFTSLSLAHAANVLRHVGDGPHQASRIVALCGVSKQAVSQQITHLERNGYLRVTPHPTDHRVRVLETTEKGRRAKAFVDQTMAEMEADWFDSLGVDDDGQLRRILMALSQRFEI